ncbi:MAG: glycosyltransferase family 2 protein [Magnetococcales bacterium]|nr:glycosyltransferase family 2 protein [Magnetococcales bacterium]
MSNSSPMLEEGLPRGNEVIAMHEALRDGLSAVVIGRNEEDFLPLTLPPLRAVADEIIFVDTGSEDRTIDIAEEHGCRIFRKPWQDDFSDAKNFGLDQARHSWILNVDCDEAVDGRPEVRRQLREKCLDDAEGKPVFIINIDNLMADGGVKQQDAMRLFRNDPRIRFEHPIHESVCDSVYRNWPEYKPEKIDVCLTHYGYRRDANKDKLKRNIAILRAWMEREPDHIFGNYKLGMNLHYRGNVSEGLFFLGRAFELICRERDKASYPFLKTMIPFYVNGLIEDGRVAEARAVREKVLSWEE